MNTVCLFNEWCCGEGYDFLELDGGVLWYGLSRVDDLDRGNYIIVGVKPLRVCVSHHSRGSIQSGFFEFCDWVDLRDPGSFGRIRFQIEELLD